MENGRLRTFGIFIFAAFALIYLLPNLVELPKGWWLHKKPLNYGLDIQGGAHLVYGVDVKGVLEERTERSARAIAEELKTDGVQGATVDPTADKKSLVIKTASEGDRAKASKLLNDRYAGTLQVVNDSGTSIEAKYYDAVITSYREQVINQAIQVIRNRVDEFGVAEPVIAAQGTDRILVQLPGISDPARAKELINKTARLDFRLVDESIDHGKLEQMVGEVEKAGNFALAKDGLSYAQYVKKVNEGLKGKIPEKTMVAFEKNRAAATMEAGKIPYLVRLDSDVTGDLLEDAFLSQGEFGEPKVSFRFGTEGRRKFGTLTGNNVRRRLAIVLDEVIFSAPTINERIDGEGQISLGTSNAEEGTKEGQLIATALRAGALPAALQQMEERSVGPSLGQDSISKGKLAGAIGLAAVVVFAIAWYKLAGVIAAITLSLNVVGLLSILSALGATLTLPGIAGISLTVGMAIDANVIIFERIKEEIARGLSLKAAIKAGFDNAWSAILDANVTSAIAASVLIYFGSGAVRGFGVTMLAGIVSTLITAVFVTKYLLDILVVKFNVKKHAF